MLKVPKVQTGARGELKRANYRDNYKKTNKAYTNALHQDCKPTYDFLEAL
jgi:hypothetical protein